MRVRLLFFVDSYSQMVFTDDNQSYFRIPECLKPQHRITPLLHLPMILLNHIIQVLVGPDERLSGQGAFGLQFGDGSMGRPTAVERDLLRGLVNDQICARISMTDHTLV